MIEEQDPVTLTPEEYDAQDIVIKHGLKYNKSSGELIPMTKREM